MVDRLQSQERWPVSLSVAVLLSTSNDELILVRNRANKTWGLPAGGIEKGEFPKDALEREIREETAILPKQYEYKGLEPHVICIPGEDKTRIGLVYDAIYTGSDLPINWWKVDDDKVDFAMAFSKASVAELIKQADIKVYKPEFNAIQLIRWLYNK